MGASDARPFPLKNTAYRVTFPIFDADGDLVTGAASLDTELSGDGGTFADATNEATEIATSSGMYYLDLTAGEMNYDTVAIVVKTSTSGAKTTPMVLYPVEATDIPVNVKAISDDTTSADNLESYTDGTTPAPVNVTQISGDGTAADNLEAACDGTTYNIGGGAVVAASVTGAVGSVTGAVGSVAGVVSGNVEGSVQSVIDAVTVGGLDATAKAHVNAEVIDALAVDTYAEPGSVPAATASLKDMVHWLFSLARNKRTTTSAAETLRNDGDSGDVATAALTDDGSTFTRGEWS